MRCALLVLLMAGSVLAGTPRVLALVPRGGQRGTEVNLSVFGERLADAEGVLFFEPGIELLSIEAKSERDIRLRLRIALHCELGVHRLMVRCQSGLSNLVTFHVGALPERREKEPNNSPLTAQPIAPWVTMNGVIQTEDWDWFSVDLPARQRLSIEVEGIRLGVSAFDPCLEVLGPDGRTIAVVDDTFLGRMDPFVSFMTETSGTYRIGLRESSFRGQSNCFYRLHVGTFPRPSSVWPLAAKRRESTEIRNVEGEPPFRQLLALDGAASTLYEFFPRDAGGIAPTPVQLLAASGEIAHEPTNASSLAKAPLFGAWHLIGPFQNGPSVKGLGAGHDAAFAPEVEVDLLAAHEGRDGEVRWTPRPDFEDGKVIDLLPIAANPEWALCYLYRRIESAADQELVARMGSDDTVKVWLNGVLLHDHREHRGLVEDQDVVTLPLRRGTNELLVKVCNGTGGFGFQFRTDPLSVLDSAVPMAAPGTAYGVIATDGETDAWVFEAKKGEDLQLATFARRLRTPVDLTMQVLDEAGRVLASNDDAGSPDPRIRLQVPKDGRYVVTVRDHLDQGAASYAYTLQIGARYSGFSSRFVPRSRTAQPLVDVPIGGRSAIVLRATGGRVGEKFAFDRLPTGVTYELPPILEGATDVPVVFSAAPDAERWASRSRVTTVKDGEKSSNASYSHRITLVEVGNQQPYVTETLREMPVSVVKALPFSVDLVEPAVPLVRGSPLGLTVKLNREEGFTGNVVVRMLWAPPGVTAGVLTIPAGKSEGTLPLNAAADAPAREWPVAVIATADVRGEVVTSSQLVTLKVIEPLVVASLGKARAERGTVTTLPVKLTWKGKPLAGCKAELLNVPRGVNFTAPDILPGDPEFVWSFDLTAEAALGPHRNLLLRLQVPMAGGVAVHTIRGGELRIDQPLVPQAEKVAAPTKTVPKPPANVMGTVKKPKT